MSNRIGLALLTVGLCVTVGFAVDDKKEPTKVDPKNNATMVKSAATVDFVSELGLDFGTLETLGVRIDQARENPDPMGLTLAALELAAAEQVAGKVAGIKAEELRKEAIDMAIHRQTLKEMKAISLLVTDEASKKQLKATAVAVQECVDK